MVSPPVAEAILRQYPTLQLLVSAIEKDRHALSQVVITRQGSDPRLIGDALSARVSQVFLGTDPDMILS